MTPETVMFDKSLINRINQAQSYTAMAQIALEILRSVEGPVAELCGPISTGGLGSVEGNLSRFDQKIRELMESGINVFNQTPFETPMQKLKEKPGFQPLDLLEGFYLPLLESGKIAKMYFLPDWQSSFGARWEHDQAKRLGIEIVYLKK